MLVKEKKGTALLTGAILTAVFAAIFFLTLLTPMVADDYNYAFSWATDQRVRSLGDVWDSMACHRSYTNGRVFAHGFVQLFTFLPRWLFALCNAAVSAGLAFLLQLYLQRGSGRPRPGLLLCTLALLWLCMPVFGQVFLWLDGACNYAWGLFLALGLLYPFYAAYLEGAQTVPRPGQLLLIPLAFLAGAWSEHISFSLLAACFFVLLALWIRDRRFSWGLFALLFSGGLGYLYLMLAPSMLGGGAGRRGKLSPEAVLRLLRGLGDRLAFLPGGWKTALTALVLALAALILCLLRLGRRKTLGLLAAGASLLGLLAAAFLGLRILRAGGGLYGLLSSTPLSLALALCCFLIPFALALFRGAELRSLLFPGLVFLGGLCSLPLFVFASYFPARGAAAAVLFSVLGGGLLLASGRPGRGRRAAALLLTLLFALSLALGTADILAVHRSERQRQEQIREALLGDGIARVSPHPVRGKYSAQYGLADVTGTGQWPNDPMARYYGLKGFRLN